jgi:hypothetical protein
MKQVLILRAPNPVLIVWLATAHVGCRVAALQWGGQERELKR